MSVVHLAPTHASTDSSPVLQNILLLVGQLNYAWTNTESLLIHLIAGLAQVDKETAIIIFLTLNTTRARLDLVERLAKMDRIESECRHEILAVVSTMTKESRLRNKYNHCIYAFDEEGRNAKTILMRIVDGKESMRYGKAERIDSREMARLRASKASIEKTNRHIWKIVKDYGFPM
jgi:hypothetical protein